MAFEARGGAGLHIRRGADLQRNTVVVHVVEEVAVFLEVGAVADAVRATVMQCLVNRLRSVALARVKGAVDVVVQDEEKRLAVFLGRIVFFLTRQIKGHHAAVFVSDGQFRQPI